MNNLSLLGMGIGALAGAGAAVAISKYYDLDGVETALAVGGGAVLGGAGGYLVTNLICPEDTMTIESSTESVEMSDNPKTKFSPIEMHTEADPIIIEETACTSEANLETSEPNSAEADLMLGEAAPIML